RPREAKPLADGYREQVRTFRSRIHRKRAAAASRIRARAPALSAYDLIKHHHLRGSSIRPSRLIPAVEFIRSGPCPDPGARRAALAVTRSRALTIALELQQFDGSRASRL